MKYFFIFFILILLFINSFKLHAEDSLTSKQQLDRIMEEIKDLNKAVFNKSFNKSQIYLNENDAEKFTSIDIRIYDLQKDIKNLTLQFEEILFKIDDLGENINILKVELNEKFNTNQMNSENTNANSNIKENNQSLKIDEENTLGVIVISDNQPSSKLETENLVEKNQDLNQDKEQELNNLPPEDQLQFALDQMMKKNYDNSKNILKDFIKKFPENQISGSAHFWLGKIYLFELNYRKAAIIFGEGVQKFPDSIKAAEMYYELAKSLKEMDKKTESCKTLILLEEKYKGNKFTKDPEKIKNSLNCKSQD